MSQLDNGLQKWYWREEVKEVHDPARHDSIAERPLAEACPGKALGTFGIDRCGKHVYIGVTPLVAKLKKDGMVEGPLMHLTIQPAERVRQCIVLRGNVGRYWEDVVIQAPLPKLDSKIEEG